MHQVAISYRMHSHSFYSQFLARTQYTKRDFATIGYENLIKHD